MAAASALFFSAQQSRNEQQSQIGERYSNAVEHLGDSAPADFDNRIGGIYALERVAVDSHADQPTVVAVLSAFVRNHLPAAPSPPVVQGAPSDPTCQGSTPAASPARPPGRRVTNDVAAALEVLDARARQFDGPAVVDLAGACLRGYNLIGARIRGGVDLPGPNLSGANLSGAALAGADLSGDDLRNADLTGTDLAGARLSRVNLTGADLTGAVLTGVDLTGADLTGTRGLPPGFGSRPR